MSLVWYTAYGSNLLRARFSTYLEGGPVPFRTDGSIQDGARDPTPPRDDRPVELAHRLWFGGPSRAWGGGGIAFLDHPDEGTSSGAGSRSRSRSGSGPVAAPRARCRLWLITAEQFADIARQENGAASRPTVDLDQLAADGHHDLDHGWYQRMLYLGPGPDDLPMVTVTSAHVGHPPLRAAHLSYLRVVGLGLLERFDITAEEAAAYLASCAGNAGTVDASHLAAELARIERSRRPHEPAPVSEETP